MKCASSLATSLALVLGFLALPAQAGPVSSMDLKAIAGEGAEYEQVRYGCYWHRGHWHCPQHRYRRYYYGYYDGAYGTRARERRRDRIVCGRYSYWDGNACQPGRRPY
jgi:hypothetical protein